eukprot:6462107-Amphidinium_carterae.2
MSSESNVDVVRSIGQFKERYRWKLDDPHCPRDRALPDQMPESAGFFPEVPAEIMDSAGWHHTYSVRWRGAGSSGLHCSRMFSLESRAAGWLARHLVRNLGAHHHRHVLLGDNLGVTAALSKGRASSWEINAVCREVAALCLVANCRMYFSWVPSELNVADGASRHFGTKATPAVDSTRFAASSAVSSHSRGVDGGVKIAARQAYLRRVTARLRNQNVDIRLRPPWTR